MDWGVPGRKRVEEKSQLFFCLQPLIWIRNNFQTKFLAFAFVDIVLDDIISEVHSVGEQQVLGNRIGNQIRELQSGNVLFLG